MLNVISLICRDNLPVTLSYVSKLTRSSIKIDYYGYFWWLKLLVKGRSGEASITFDPDILGYMSKQKQLQCVVYWPPRNWHLMYVNWVLWRQKDLWKNVGNSWLLNFDVITTLGWEMVNILKCLQAFGDNLKSPPRLPLPFILSVLTLLKHSAPSHLGKHFLRLRHFLIWHLRATCHKIYHTFSMNR